MFSSMKGLSGDLFKTSIQKRILQNVRFLSGGRSAFQWAIFVLLSKLIVFPSFRKICSKRLHSKEKENEPEL